MSQSSVVTQVSPARRFKLSLDTWAVLLSLGLALIVKYAPLPAIPW